MKIIDISQTYERGMLKYPSIHDFDYEWLRNYEHGDSMALSKMHLPCHLGTHIDSPYHFLADGYRTIDIPLENLCGDVQVIEAIGRPSITKKFLETQEFNSKRLIFKTDNTPLEKNASEDYNNVYFETDACEYMVEKGIILVGIDYFGVDKKGDKQRRAHLPLLKGKIIILEGLVLDNVKKGLYTLYCLPLKVKDVEGVPARTILIEEE